MKPIYTLGLIYLKLHSPDELIAIGICFGIAMLIGAFLMFLQYLLKPEPQQPEIKKYTAQTKIKGRRILVVSDMHYGLTDEEREVIQQDYDECWILGDIESPVLEELKNKKNCRFYAVSGNHETEKSFSDLEWAEDLHGKAGVSGDYTITGISGCSKYKENTPFCMWSQKTSREIVDEMFKCDILITHDSPYQKHSQSINKEGLQGITKYIEKYQPKLHIYGHHHLFADYNIGETQCICNYRLGFIDIDGVYHTV